MSQFIHPCSSETSVYLSSHNGSAINFPLQSRHGLTHVHEFLIDDVSKTFSCFGTTNITPK